MSGLPAYPWWCRSSCFGAVPITLLAIFKFPIIWLNPFLVPVVMVFGYVLFYWTRRLTALRVKHKAHALGLEEA